MFSSLAWVPGTKEFVVVFHTAYIHVIYFSVYVQYYMFYLRKKKKDGVCPDSALFSHPISTLVFSWQRGGGGPLSQFLSVSEGVRGLWEVRAFPLQLGPATPEWEGLGEAGPGEAGWLCCLCQLWGLGQGSGPPVVSLIQREHSH